MSWLDLIDDDSLNRFVSGRDEGDGGDEQLLYGGEEADDEAAFLADEEYSTSELEDVTAPPPVSTLYGTEVLNVSMLFDNEEEEESYTGVTIVSSVPSSATVVYDTIGAPASAHVGSSPTTNNASISTMEESASLSMHMDSLESSVMTNVTLSSVNTTSVSSDEEQSESSDDTSMGDTSDLQDASVEKDDCTETSDGQISEATTKLCATNEDQLKLWYSRLKTEQDWDEFREAAHELLSAIDCPVEDQDDLIAQLIAEEEGYFWGSKTSDSCVVAATQPKTWLLELATVAAAVAVTSVALIKILKGR
jgi:hypothetical protein